VIRHHRQRLGMTEQALAERVGVSRGAVQQWEKGTTAPKRANQDEVATALGISVAELMCIRDAPPAPALAPVPGGAGVPLVSWVQAGDFSDLADQTAVEDWLPCPVRHGPRTYCLRVRGDSMHNPAGRPSYADGDVIYVDPDLDAKPGDRVVVRLDDQPEATFKQLLHEDGRKLLKALNPEWAPRYIEINGNASIVGVVIGKWVPE